MKFWVGVTDKDWFDYLMSLEPEEANFWQPSETPPTKQLQAGDLFLFKLHTPHNYVVGGGFFVRFTRLPARIAWESFGNLNGVRTYGDLIRRIEHYRKKPVPGDAEIGCNLLNAPFFFSQDQWIPIPSEWSPNIVRGKTYNSAASPGAELFDAVQARLRTGQAKEVETEHPRYGDLYLTRARLGQGTFRVLVTDAYHRRCAVTGEKTLPALEAAHIRPHAAEGPNHVNNGLLLRADVHRLFDNGYVTVDSDLKFVVSPRVRAEFENGREYYRYQGKPLLNLPDSPTERPSRDFIDWHNNEVYAD